MQGKNELVSHYAMDMSQRIQAGITNDTLARYVCFYRGLFPSIKSQIPLSRPQTLSECEKYAKVAKQNFATNGNSPAKVKSDAINKVSNALKGISSLGEKISSQQKARASNIFIPPGSHSF